MDVTKEEMKQKPKCPLRSGLLSSPTVYRKEKVTQQFWYLVITLKISLSAASRWKSNLVSHTYTHIQPSRGSQYRYSFVSLKLHHIIIVLINTKQNCHSSVSQTKVRPPLTWHPSESLCRLSAGRASPLPPNRVETTARRAPFPSHGSPEPHNTLLYWNNKQMLPVHLLDLSFVYSFHRTDIVDSCYVIVAL